MMGTAGCLCRTHTVQGQECLKVSESILCRGQNLEPTPGKCPAVPQTKGRCPRVGRCREIEYKKIKGV